MEGPNSMLRPGTVLLGKYEIVGLLGRGGFGLVYEAMHTGLRSLVALKVLNPEARQNPQTVARFRQEAWTSAQIASPHVVRVMDIDVLADGTPFLVMEHLMGQDLEREIRARGRLPVREAVDYLLQAASGVREAHARGVIHRDLKTSNLFLVNEPSGRKIKVLDFGLSKIAAKFGMTATYSALGTPSYAAPEQLRSAKDADARSDIWSLGVILYQLLSGRRPFAGKTMADLIVEIGTTQAPDLARVAPDVPAGVCQAVMRTLAKKPAQRFQTVDEFARAIAPFGTPGMYGMNDGPRSARASRPPEPALGPSSTFLDSTKDTPPEQRRNRLRTGIALTAVTVLLTVGVGITLGRSFLVPAPPSTVAEPERHASPPSAAHGAVAPVATVTPPAVARPAVAPLAAPLPSVAPSVAPPPSAAVTAPAKKSPAARPLARPAPRRKPGEPNLGF